LAEYYYTLGLIRDELNCIIRLLKLFKLINNIKYDSLLLTFIEKYKNILHNHIDVFHNDRHFNILTNNTKFILYNNKCNLNFKIATCDVCYEDNIKLIPFECSHFVCMSCYMKLNKCHICRFKIE